VIRRDRSAADYLVAVVAGFDMRDRYGLKYGLGASADYLAVMAVMLTALVQFFYQPWYNSLTDIKAGTKLL
jgi:hypothetical protein